MNESLQARFERAQQRINRAKEKFAWPTNVPVEIAERADRIDETYDERYSSEKPAPSAWETVAQTASKLRVVAGEPNKFDPKGKLKKKYEAIISAFDLETETFPSNFDPNTGIYQITAEDNGR